MRILPLLVCLSIPAVGFPADVDLLAAYSQLREIALDPQHVAAVENLELKKDAAVFRFKSGTQQNVPDGFISQLPFVLRTKGGVMSGRLVVQHPTMHQEVKLKEKPEVEINPLYGWLCELDVKKR